MSEKRKVLIVNGPSGSGKTLAIRLLQHIWPQLSLHLGIDKLWEMFPRKYLENGVLAHEGIQLKANNTNVPFYFHGQLIYPVETIMSNTSLFIADSFAKYAGMMANYYDLFIDEVLLEKERIAQYLSYFSPEKHDIYIVGFECDLDVLMERTLLRGDRMLGLPLDQYEKVHRYMFYDAILDVSDKSTDYVARFLKDLISHPANYSAFTQIKNHLK